MLAFEFRDSNQSQIQFTVELFKLFLDPLQTDQFRFLHCCHIVRFFHFFSPSISCLSRMSFSSWHFFRSRFRTSISSSWFIVAALTASLLLAENLAASGIKAVIKPVTAVSSTCAIVLVASIEFE